MKVYVPNQGVFIFQSVTPPPMLPVGENRPVYVLDEYTVTLDPAKAHPAMPNAIGTWFFDGPPKTVEEDLRRAR